MEAMDTLTTCPNWDRVSPEEQQDAVLRVRICRELDSAAHGEGGPCIQKWADCLSGKPGFSAQNIRNFYYQCWRVSAGSVCRMIRYDTLRKTEAGPLPSYNLSPEKVRHFLREKGMTKKRWAETHGFVGREVNCALRGSRRTAMCARILTELAADVNGHERKLVKDLEQLRRQHKELSFQIAALERRLGSPLAQGSPTPK